MTVVNGTNGHSRLPAEFSSGPQSVQPRPVNSKNLLKLLDEQGKCCALTGVALTPQTVSLDHIVPIHEDGPDDMSNVQLVHATINTMKGTMSQDEFVRWCKLVAGHHA